MGLLRLLLAAAVIISHMGLAREYMINGSTAVRIFFMISGFYMAMILSEKYGKTHAGLINFAVNRFLRLYPTYIIVLLLTLSWYLLCVKVTRGRTPQPPILEIQSMVPHWQALLLWMVNLTLVGIDLPSIFHWSPNEGFVFLKNLPFEEQPNLIWVGFTVWVRQAWSIGSEIWFYILSPFIVFGPIHRVLLVAAGSGLLGLLAERFAGIPTQYFWPALLIYFVTGILLYKLYKATNLPIHLPHSLLFRKLVVASPVLWLVALPCVGFPIPDFLLFCISAISIPVLFATTMRSDFDRFMGNLSYATYLDHLLVAGIIDVASRRVDLSAEEATPLVILGSIALASVLERFIERPIDQIRAHYARS